VGQSRRHSTTHSVSDDKVFNRRLWIRTRSFVSRSRSRGPIATSARYTPQMTGRGGYCIDSVAEHSIPQRRWWRNTPSTPSWCIPAALFLTACLLTGPDGGTGKGSIRNGILQSACCSRFQRCRFLRRDCLPGISTGRPRLKLKASAVRTGLGRTSSVADRAVGGCISRAEAGGQPCLGTCGDEP